MYNNKIQEKLAQIAGAHASISRSVPGIIAALTQMGCFSSRQVKLLADAVRADVVDDLVPTPSESLRGIVRERLVSRMVSEMGSYYDEAVWAVSAWSCALWGEPQADLMAVGEGAGDAEAS